MKKLALGNFCLLHYIIFSFMLVTSVLCLFICDDIDIKHPDNGLEEINHKQAYMLYEMMAQYRQDIQKSGLKKWF